MTTELGLKEVFYKEYDGFADKRIKKLENGTIFTVDDRGPGDYDARKELFLWFCKIWVEVNSADTITVKMGGDIPQSPQVQAWFDKNGATQIPIGIQFVIACGEQDALLGLADAIASIVAPGRRYKTPSYKYVCPRTAHSLMRLRTTLHKGWKKT